MGNMEAHWRSIQLVDYKGQDRYLRISCEFKRMRFRYLDEAYPYTMKITKENV